MLKERSGTLWRLGEIEERLEDTCSIGSIQPIPTKLSRYDAKHKMVTYNCLRVLNLIWSKHYRVNSKMKILEHVL